MQKSNDIYRAHEAYRKYKADLKITQIRLMHCGKEEEAFYYKNLLNQLEKIREKRHLAQKEMEKSIKEEQNEEKILYEQILQIIMQIYEDYEKVDDTVKLNMFQKATHLVQEQLKNKDNRVKNDEKEKIEESER